MTPKAKHHRDVGKEWLLPASIPFAELKARDLEECVYWLLDSMGAKDLQWRTGGTGGGAADGGRDLEALLYTPTADGEIEAQKWWIECKGRSGTVDPGEVKAAITNASAFDELDYVVIATNTQFSNPTRDWVKQWQAKNSSPKVKLWDHEQLELYLSHHPDVVLRLFSEALSLEGRFTAMESRFWNKVEFVSPKTLMDIWKARNEMEFTAMGVFALIANEFVHGSITHRPWAAILSPEFTMAVLSIGLYNAPYLALRSSRAGVDQAIVCRVFAYLILRALDVFSAKAVAEVISDSLNRGGDVLFPEDILKMLLMPIVDQLLSEIQDVCSSDCERMMFVDRSALSAGKDEVESYWLRLAPDGLEEPQERKMLRLEKLHEPCVVGFPVDEHHHCPLFSFEPTVKNTADLLAIVERVVDFRKAQALGKHDAEKRKAAKKLKKTPEVT